MERFLHFIVNKQSRNSDATFKSLLIELPKHAKNYEISVTESIEQLDKLLFELKSTINKKDMIVVVGGDGSLNQFITLYKKYKLENYIGYIPAGSGNDFARAHQIPIDTKKAIIHLFHVQKEQQISVVHATQGDIEHYAVNSIGIGIDGLIISLVNSGRMKKKFGPASYLLGVLSGFIKQKKFPITIKVDDGVYQFDNVQLALIANNPYFGGGVHIIPGANGKDDLLEVLIANDVSAKNLISILSKVLTNKKHLLHPKLHSFTSKNVAFYTESQQYGQKDGEMFEQEGFAYTFTTEHVMFWI